MKNFLTTDGRTGRILSIVAVGIIIVITVLMCQPAQAQDVERAKTTSVQKVKKFGTKYLVCVVTESGKSYRTIYNAHCYTCAVNVPQRWTVVTKKNRSFIKAEE